MNKNIKLLSQENFTFLNKVKHLPSWLHEETKLFHDTWFWGRFGDLAPLLINKFRLKNCHRPNNDSSIPKWQRLPNCLPGVLDDKLSSSRPKPRPRPVLSWADLGFSHHQLSFLRYASLLMCQGSYTTAFDNMHLLTKGYNLMLARVIMNWNSCLLG